MSDDGLNGGDERAGDGIYSIVLTDYQANNTIVQFYVEASRGAVSTAQPKLGAERPALYVVDNDSSAIPMDLRTQRFVMSLFDRDALTAAGHSSKFDWDFPRMANHYFNATFISNEQKIFYNAEIRKSGSPFTRNTGNALDHGKWKLPADRYFRNQRKRVIDPSADVASMRHNDRIARYFLYQLGHPVNENEFVRVIVNYDNASLREDMEPIASDYLSRNFENGTDGTLMRIDDEWFFQDFNANGTAPRRNVDADWLYKNSDAAIRYHSEWLIRSREADYDYTGFVEFVKTLNQGAVEANMDRLMHHNLCALNAAVRGYDGDWDTFTVGRGKNGYFYRRPDGLWMLVHWDGDRTFENSNQAILRSGAGVPTYFNQPYVRRLMNYYLTTLVDKHTLGSSRTAAWMQAEEDASASYNVDTTKFNNWFSARTGTVSSFVGAAYSTVFDVTSPGGTTASDLHSISGVSPSDIYTIHIPERPGATIEWTTTSAWTLSNIWLTNGLNSISVVGLDHEGVPVETNLYSITKTGSAPPIMDLDSNPKSMNLGVAEMLQLDASGSFDPEGGALTYAWSVVPGNTVSLVANGAAALATFSRPGLYAFTVTATDDQNNTASVTREAAVYHIADFESFGGTTWSPAYHFDNLAVRGNYAPSTWYSLQDVPGKLVLQVLDDSSKPLVYNGATFPQARRDLPSDGNFLLQSDLTLADRQFGNFHTGLSVELMESGASVRYYFGIEDGDTLAVKRLTSSSMTTGTTIPWESEGVVFRIRRVGGDLRFDVRVDAVWTTVHTYTLPAGSSGIEGGLFTVTDSAESVRTEFDYLFLIDEEATSDALDYLRISEIMYEPIAGGALEYIEVFNTGPAAIDIEGVYFEGTRPFDEFVFGSATLNTGEYAVVVADIAAFVSAYGSGPQILGQWPGGALANEGERVVLRDALGNVIHDFSYNNTAPWPVAAAGAGPSLEVIDPEGNYDSHTNWMASVVGGSPGTPVPEDVDGDGLSNADERARGTNSNLFDTDGDGADDGTEVAAGTDPLDADSTMKIATVVQDTVGGDVTITWATVAGKNYRLEYKVALTDPSWLEVVGGANISASTNMTSFVDTSVTQGEARRFYRAGVLSE
jgi:hypothetical protein